jgi:UDP-N-acetylmuramate--alanine ligase
VVEADEYKNAFHEYSPQIAIILNVEPDHLDFFGTPEAYREAFLIFARKVVPGGLLLLCADDPGAMVIEKQVGGVQFAVESYGLNARDNWMAGRVRQTGSDVIFDVVRQGDLAGEMKIPRPGRHVALNGLAATATALHAGAEFGDIRKALGDFQGARRRFEFKGEREGVVVMDDYAHHPSEVRTILDAARTRFGARRLIGVYQPHTYSRISYLWEDWRTCWGNLDALIVVETYAARETPLPGRSASDLAHAIDRPDAVYAPDFEAAANMAVQLAKPGDVIFTIGAGDVVDVGPMILERLP